MPFTAELRDGYVFIRHEGDVTLAEAQAASGEALRLARQNKSSRIMVDIRGAGGDADPQDLRTLMESNAEVTPPRPHAAILVREDQYRRFRFIEDFAVSRAMPIRVFVSEDEASDWLAD